jgi:hypothetical protein
MVQLSACARAESSARQQGFHFDVTFRAPHTKVALGMPLKCRLCRTCQEHVERANENKRHMHVG